MPKANFRCIHIFTYHWNFMQYHQVLGKHGKHNQKSIDGRQSYILGDLIVFVFQPIICFRIFYNTSINIPDVGAISSVCSLQLKSCTEKFVLLIWIICKVGPTIYSSSNWSHFHLFTFIYLISTTFITKQYESVTADSILFLNTS